MKKLFILCLCAILFCCAILFLPTAHDRAIYDKTLRLHVLADSDDEEDQAEKLAVRDEVLALLEEEMTACDSKEDAKAVILENKERIQAACEALLQTRGSEHSVKIELSEEYYPTREYEEIALPAGKYLSLRVMIGQAEGKNWWCVLYPPVCLGACSAKQKLAGAGFDGEQVKLVTEGSEVRYAVKFKVLEVIGRFWGKLFG